MLATFVAQIATLVPFLFGLVTATVIATTAPEFIEAGDYVGGLLSVSPGWYFVPVCHLSIPAGLGLAEVLYPVTLWVSPADIPIVSAD